MDGITAIYAVGYGNIRAAREQAPANLDKILALFWPRDLKMFYSMQSVVISKLDGPCYGCPSEFEDILICSSAAKAQVTCISHGRHVVVKHVKFQ